jgi:uncharacterized protein YgbK (DUF1537 family)
MPDLTVIADDLTGAADCGIAFALAGLPAFVAFAKGGLPADAQVLALDTDSRAVSAEEAARRVHKAARDAWAGGARTLYKKIDSTLRGHVGEEVAAAVAAAKESGRRPVVIAAPAFPALGRTTFAGRVFVDGIPLERTEVWRKSGMTGPADIAGQLRASGLRVAGADLEAVRSETLPQGADAIVCDADREEDLRHVAEAGARIDAAVIWVGSGGLARHLPPALRLRPAAEAVRRFVPRAGPVLALVGSRSSVAREQARELCAEPRTECIEIAPDALFSERDVPEALHALQRGDDLVLIIAAGDEVDLSRSLRLAGALARLAAPLIGRVVGAIATGGDIARALLAAIGASGLWLAGEVEPGVPIGITDTQPPLAIVTKAGAFGNPSTLRRCRAALGPRSK